LGIGGGSARELATKITKNDETAAMKQEKHRKVELIIVMQYLPEWQIVSPAIVKS
jgi:hypothetical protein